MKRFALLAAVLALAGCGGTAAPRVVQPHLPRALASEWRAQSDAVAAALAAGDGCEAKRRAAQLQGSVIAAINARRVAPRFQETLLATVNELAARIGCTPPPAPAPAPVVHGNGHGDGQGHGKGHGKHGKGGD